jgi:glycosyltransferase involved in cell wall biosynthesis
LLTDQAFTERLRQAGLARAKAFSWERAAKETVRVYQELE